MQLCKERQSNRLYPMLYIMIKIVLKLFSTLNLLGQPLEGERGIVTIVDTVNLHSMDEDPITTGNATSVDTDNLHPMEVDPISTGNDTSVDL
jgi:hypothetical protein